MSKFTETLLDDHFPDLLPSQRAKIIGLKGQLWGDMSSGGYDASVTPFALSFLSSPEGAKMVRKVPGAAEVQAAKEAAWMRAHEATRVPADVRIEISRSLSSMSDDAKLDAVADLPADPKNGATITPTTSEVSKLDAAAPSGNTYEEDNHWLREHMGIENPGALLNTKRAEYLQARNAIAGNSQSLRRDALRVDELSSKDASTLSAVDRLTLFRAQEALKKAG